MRLCAFAPLRLIVFSADAPRRETQLNAKEQRRKDAKGHYYFHSFCFFNCWRFLFRGTLYRMTESEKLFSHFNSSWRSALASELQQPYLADLAAFLEGETHPIYPPRELIFNAFQKTPFDEVKVVILGQDPYHAYGQAHGLCFSVPKNVSPPPSLQNIFKEMNRDMGIPIPKQGCLEAWAEQGILLLNTTLTVREGAPLSHHGKGWERFTDAVLVAIYKKKEPTAFVLWGKSAQEKYKKLKGLADGGPHLILQGPHPSPLSAHRGFFGCGHFSKINQFLIETGQTPISWNIFSR